MKYVSNSREAQDLFILCVLNGKRNGTYIEIGAGPPVAQSNTYLLESDFGWTGVSFDIDERYVSLHKEERKNPCFQVDASKEDISKYLGDQTHFDFIQFDISPPSNTLKALKNFDLSTYEFSIVTFEHDAFAGGLSERDESRQILLSAGYTMVIDDVSHGNRNFEDWYIHEKHMTSDNWQRFYGSGVNMNFKNMSEETKSVFDELLGSL